MGFKTHQQCGFYFSGLCFEILGSVVELMFLHGMKQLFIFWKTEFIVRCNGTKFFIRQLVWRPGLTPPYNVLSYHISAIYSWEGVKLNSIVSIDLDISDFQKAVNFLQEFLLKLSETHEQSAELRDSLNMCLLHLQKYYKVKKKPSNNICFIDRIDLCSYDPQEEMRSVISVRSDHFTSLWPLLRSAHIQTNSNLSLLCFPEC